MGKASIPRNVVSNDPAPLVDLWSTTVEDKIDEDPSPLIIVFLSGCGSAPQNIPTNTVSAAPYRELSCEILAQQLLCTRHSLSEYEAAQRGESVWDGVLNVLVFRSLGAVTPGHADQIAKYKGRVETIQRGYDGR